MPEIEDPIHVQHNEFLMANLKVGLVHIASLSSETRFFAFDSE
jgi:hypothetical protein